MKTLYALVLLASLYLAPCASSLEAQHLVEKFTVANTAGPGLSDGWIMDLDGGLMGIIYVATRDGGLNYLIGDQWGILTVEDGLPSDHIEQVAIDKNLGLWVGTDLGYVKLHFGMVISPGDLFPELSSIKSMVKDRFGDLWFGTNQGLFKYDGTNLSTMFPDMNFKGRSMVLIDQNGNTWIGRERDGLYYYNGTEWIKYDTDNGLSSINIFCLGADTLGNILVGTVEGLDIFDGLAWQNQVLESAALDIKVSQEGDIWVATTYDTYLYKDGEWTIQDLGLSRHHKQPRRIEITSSGSVIIGRHHGISIKSGNMWTHYSPTIGLGGISIFDMMTASDGKIWISAENRSLSVYDEGVWENYNVFNVLGTGLVWDIAECMDGFIWLATGRGVRKFVDGNWTSYRKSDGLNHETISSILIRNDGSVWVGSFGGVCRLVEDSWQCMTTANGLVDDKVYDMVEDSEDNLWFATDAGISKFDGITWINYTTENGLSHNRILCLLVDSQGWIWAGHPHGVDRWDGSAWTNFNEPFDYKVVRDIIEVPEGHIWFASNSLVHFDGNQFSNFDAGISPLDYYISFTLDKLGRLWAGTDKSGIFILDQLTTKTKELAYSELEVYPNPTTGSLFVELLKGASKVQHLTIHNLYGQKLLEMELSDHHEYIQLDLTSYANGAYLVSLLRDHNISTHRVVVHK